MKTLTSLKYIPAIIAIAVFALVFNSCKKADLKPVATMENINIDAEKAKVAKLMEKEGGIPQIFTRQQPVTTFWGDQNRKPLTKEQMQNNFVSQCNFDLPEYANLVQYARVYRCANGSAPAGYFLQFEFEVSWNNNIVKFGTGGNRTTGFADIIDPGGVNVQSLSFDNTNSDVQIVDIGTSTNPSFPNNHIFRVKFVTTDFTSPINHLVPETYINTSGYSVNFSAMFVTDCKTGGNPYSLWTIPVTSYGFTGASGNDPCKRNDKAWVSTVIGGAVSQVAGYTAGGFASCGFGSTFIATDLQEVEYNLDGAGFLAMNNTTATGLGIANSAFARHQLFLLVLRIRLSLGTGMLNIIQHRHLTGLYQQAQIHYARVMQIQACPRVNRIIQHGPTHTGVINFQFKNNHRQLQLPVVIIIFYWV